jgi:hypothetical protein
MDAHSRTMMYQIRTMVAGNKFAFNCISLKYNNGTGLAGFYR